MNGLTIGIIFVRFEQSSAGRITETKPEFPVCYIEEFK